MSLKMDIVFKKLNILVLYLKYKLHLKIITQIALFEQ